MEKFTAKKRWNDILSSDPYTDLGEAYEKTEFDEIVVGDEIHNKLAKHPMTYYGRNHSVHPFIEMSFGQEVEFISKLINPIKYSVTSSDSELVLLRKNGKDVATIEQPEQPETVESNNIFSFSASFIDVLIIVLIVLIAIDIFV